MSFVSSNLGEFELISRFFVRDTRPKSNVILGIGDDAALLDVPKGSDLVSAVDTIVAGRHFLEGADPRSIGHRALAVNLSDIAAMGATPLWATLALTLPSIDLEWLEEFAAGFMDLADLHGVTLVGGDTTRGPLTISVQILGSVPHGAALRRSGGQAGDWLAVSGTLGDAAAGLSFLKAPQRVVRHDVEELIRRFDYPTPRVQLGLSARGLATAAMDLSDGLVGDLPKLALASGLAAHIRVERLPLSLALRTAESSQPRALDLALGGGDDYELLFAVPAQRFAELKAAADRLNLTLSAIGELRSGAGVTWSLNGEEFLPSVSGYDHFGRASTQITV
ncbi:MAG: thiamine-monophosphate kinase [Gammaproteobacteria bacterium]|jgi:thiamine-monophosphate kinase|nr:thiamine-monophosphate kinase [Gammaproteobacteria bacterium]